MVRQEVAWRPPARLKQVVVAVGWPSSSFFRVPKAVRKRSGPPPRPLDPERALAVRQVALGYPWWGYKRIAVVCRRSGLAVSNRFVYQVLKVAGLLQRRRPRSAELYQAARLFELLPSEANELWQADVTYLHIPGFGWWYAVTVIDYFSRYLLALHLSPSNNAGALIVAVDQAIAEAERLHGPLKRGRSWSPTTARTSWPGASGRTSTAYSARSAPATGHRSSSACSSASTRRSSRRRSTGRSTAPRPRPATGRFRHTRERREW
jgi:hypothetical protein